MLAATAAPAGRAIPALQGYAAGIIGEFVPSGNAMVVVESVSLIPYGKGRICRIPSPKPMFTINGIAAVNVV